MAGEIILGESAQGPVAMLRGLWDRARAGGDGVNNRRHPAQGEEDAAAVFNLEQSEHEFMKHVMAYAKLRGWQCYHTHISKRSAEGEPDLRLVRGGVLIYAELKREKGGRLSEAQKDVLHELAYVSHRVAQTIGALGGRSNYYTAPPWEGATDCYPPMASRLVQVWVWKPSDWPTIEKVLR